ncbi:MULTISPECIES: DUF2141 domain-containing protein [Thalassotalea]|uniref:DUF2141 domain-containing protein n=1 Tax=Thalassotalea TaxID=1518149 RepID=UPI000944CFB2|nr:MULTISPECIES: DUF2141 domain-containing protein [Thalassotalea]OKY27750.1 hypothetical protein BI291_07490 [Thalassotalea sp. PP2-459]
MKIKLTIATTLLTLSANVFSHSLQLEIREVKSNQGKILAQLFKGESNYQANKPMMAQQSMAKEGTLILTFSNLENGEYAIRYFHDENSDNQLATNLIGIPTEGYGYSNNAKGNFGPAKYQDMKVSIVDSDVITHSTVIY